MQRLTTAPRRQARADVLFLVLLGTLAGFINGLLGTGGGILLVLLFSRSAERAKRGKGISFPMARRDIYANALSVMLPISIFSATQYASAGALDVKAFSPMLLPSLLGGILGGILLDRLKLSWLRTLFSLLVLISGIFMLFRG
ncbi:MAG: TSUP family transporter [Clostridia bacterium]|nr:TSUP family transporter [Clostridia bacterium]